MIDKHNCPVMDEIDFLVIDKSNQVFYRFAVEALYEFVRHSYSDALSSRHIYLNNLVDYLCKHNLKYELSCFYNKRWFLIAQKYPYQAYAQHSVHTHLAHFRRLDNYS